MEEFLIKYNNKKEQLAIEISGQLTINNIVKIIENLKENFSFNKSFKILIKDVKNMDLTFIQLIYSLISSSIKNSYNVTVSMELPDDIRQLLKSSGFNGLVTNK